MPAGDVDFARLDGNLPTLPAFISMQSCKMAGDNVAMYERFTDRARKVMELADSEARQLNHQFIGDEHILLAMIAEGEGIAGYVLKGLGMDLEKARSEVYAWEPALPDDSAMSAKLPLTPEAKRVLEESMKECRMLGHEYVGTEHLLLGLCRQNEGLPVRLLTDLGLKLEDIRVEVLTVLGHRS